MVNATGSSGSVGGNDNGSANAAATANTSSANASRNNNATSTARASIPAAEAAAWGRAPTQPEVNQAPAQTVPSQTAQPQIAQPQIIQAQTTATPAAVNPPTARELAALSAAVYTPEVTTVGRFSVATPAQLAQLGINPAQLTSTTSTFVAQVYVTGTGANMQAVVAMRGTSTANDWGANFRQAAGINTDHYARALDIGRTLAQNEITNVTFTGHSLGGGLASAAAIASGSRAVTFNAAGLSQSTIGQAQAIHNNNQVATADRVDAYYVRGDLLSALQDYGDRALGGVIGGIFGGVRGAIFGARNLDAPEAYGNRIGLEAVKPSDYDGWSTPVARHGIDFVESSMDAAGIR